MNPDTNEKPLIHLRELSKVFYTEEVETHALGGISLDIGSGEFVSIAGPSGCGKTTMLSILGLLDSPTGGMYLLDGEPVETLSAGQRAKIRNQAIGFVFQAFNLIGDLTVYENVELPLTYRGMPGGERKERVQGALERVGMAHRMGHYPSQLSGGQQQRVAVARAIVGRPLILLADEPTGNLDSATTDEILVIFEALNHEGRTIILVTHEDHVADRAKRIVRLKDGMLHTDEAVSEERRDAARLAQRQAVAEMLARE